MASVLAQNVVCLLLLLPISTVAQMNGSLKVGDSLSAADNSSWVSPSGDFAFGFRPQNSGLFLLSIWYDKIPNKTIVWYPDQGQLAPRGSKVVLNTSGLVLTSPQGAELWTSPGVTGTVATGMMNNTGNFVLLDSSSNEIWQSFDHPTDTILPSQTVNGLSSRQSETNFSQGRFEIRFDGDQNGGLVLNTINFPSPEPAKPFTLVDGDASNPGKQLVFNNSGYISVLKEDGEFTNIPEITVPTGNYYFRATLEFDGIFAVYSRSKTSTGNEGWNRIWFQPDNICLAIFVDEGPGACGFNSICNRRTDKRPRCECPTGYSLIDPNDPYGSCKPNFIQGCKEDELGDKGDLYGVEELTNVDWPKAYYLKLKPISEEDCSNSCLLDCLCAVSIFTDGNTCWKKKLPLSNGRFSQDFTGKAFIKVRKENSTLPGPPFRNPGYEPGQKKDQESLILTGSVFLGCSVLVNFLLICTGCYGFFFVYQRKIRKRNPSGSALEMNLRCFSYELLQEATHGFQEELGRGAFGTVYKGEINMGSNVLVAVKKLHMVAPESEKEFKAEVNIIGKTHHKNLVRLLGFCDEGMHRLLVYEFLSHGSLAGFLFGDLKPNWNQRIQIAFEIARGILYLHEECSTQIIHCDIKPQNILLDEYFNARISDFGLAKLWMMDQSQTQTAIRGTKGYVAPEWFRNMSVTAKVDVYSFGVMLLEIICCRRSVDMESGSEDKAILTDWAYDCFREGTLDVLVEYNMEALHDMKKLESLVKTAIWCIQEDPNLRPSMKKVMQMLEGVVDVPVPPCPSPFTTTITGI